MMTKLVKINSAMTFSLAVLFLLNLFVKSSFLENLNLLFMVVILVFALPAVTGTVRTIGYFSLLISVFLLSYYRAPLTVWEGALRENIYLVVMFILIPLLGIPVRHGGYMDALRGVFKRYIHSNSRFYLLVSMISALIAVMINVAAIPLMYQLSQASERSGNKRLVSSAISRGFATCAIWAPTTATVALVLRFTGARWSDFFPEALLLACVAGLIGWIITNFQERKKVYQDYVSIPINNSEAINWRKVNELGILGFGLILAIAIVSLVTGIGTVIVVSMASMVFPVLWTAFLGRWSNLVKVFTTEYFQESLPKLKNEIVLFVGAGLLATSISYSQLGDRVPKILGWLVGSDPTLFSVVVFFVVLLLSVLGIHPIVPVTIIASTVQASAFGVSPVFMALIFSCSWALGISISPSSANVIVIAGLTEESPIAVGAGWNGVYVILSSIVLLVTLFLLRSVGLV